MSLDKHLAELYGVTTKRLNEQVNRNIDRFPEDFMFVLTWEETDLLINSRSQIATLSAHGKNFKYRPRVFTEHGVVMLAALLNSEIAIKASLQIVRTFNRLRELILNHEELRKKIEELEKKYDTRFKSIDGRVQSVFEAFEEIKRLLNPPPDKRKKIGFI